jgi:hypothetical protein
MTDLLAPVRRTSPVVAAVAGGLVAAGATQLLAVATALAGWFAAGGGRYGDTRDATRVGADAWLLAHGAGLHLDGAAVTVLPLGLTVLVATVAYRAGRWVAASVALGPDPAELRAVLKAVAAMAAGYAAVTMVTSVLATHPRAETGLLRGVAGGFLLCALAGGTGLLVHSGQARVLLGRLPAWGRSVLTGAAVVALLLVAAAAFLVGGALLLDFGTAATVLSRLDTDGPAGLMYTLVGIGFVPNAVLLGCAYLLGPGFAVGSGTVVSPTSVVLGPLPAFPMLAALPDPGATPTWTGALVALPALLGLAGVALAFRRSGTDRLDHGAVRGLGAGLVAAFAVTLLVVLAGGAAGPGRMAGVGADGAAVFLAAALSCGAGGVVGGVAGAWWSRRRTCEA